MPTINIKTDARTHNNGFSDMLATETACLQIYPQLSIFIPTFRSGQALQQYRAEVTPVFAEAAADETKYMHDLSRSVRAENPERKRHHKTSHQIEKSDLRKEYIEYNFAVK